MITANNNNQDQVLTKHSNLQGKRRKPGFDLSTMVYGKVPPQAKELEEAVLGAILIEKGAFEQAIEILSDKSFYSDAHQAIFRAFMGLSQKSIPIDMHTVVQALLSTEELELVGGPYYIVKLTNTVVSSANIETHCRYIQEKYILRELIRISGEIINDAYDDSTDVFDLFDKTERDIYQLINNNFKKDYQKLSDGLPDMMNNIEFLKTQDTTITGVPSGYPELDKITHGWQPTDLIILAARPSVGKTAFALNLARNATINQIKPTAVGFFSLEMSNSQLLKRVVSMDTGIYLNNISTGRIHDMTSLYQSSERIMHMPVYVDDTAAINLFELTAKARRMKSKHGVGLIIIDYLQLMSGDQSRGSNREQEISSISRGLKRLAKDLEIPIIALSQLSREVEKRGKGLKVPQLSDLRESGAIEQDADLVMFLYRPAADEVLEDGELTDKGMASIAKHRNGSLDKFAFRVDNSIQRWEEIGVLENKPNNWRRVQPEVSLPAISNTNYPSNNNIPDDEMPF